MVRLGEPNESVLDLEVGETVTAPGVTVGVPYASVEVLALVVRLRFSRGEPKERVLPRAFGLTVCEGEV